MDTPEDRARLEAIFPQLANTGYEIKSPRTSDYNCVAYAAGYEDQLWDHLNEPYTYWPRRVRKDGSVQSLIDVFTTVGFGPCADGNVEQGVEKVALYGSADDKWTHAAVQRENGMWASKLGELEDIEHASLDDILCKDYGTVICFMSRPRKSRPEK